MAPYKLYQEPIQKYRELSTTDWTPTFTIQTNPTHVIEPIVDSLPAPSLPLSLSVVRRPQYMQCFLHSIYITKVVYN